MTGEERFTSNGIDAGYSLLDFWQWSHSGGCYNSINDQLAAFLVFSSFGISAPFSRPASPELVLLSPSGFRFTARAAAYIFATDPEKPPRILINLNRGNSDYFALCCFTGEEPEALFTDLDLWDFYIASSESLPPYGAITFEAFLSYRPARMNYLQLCHFNCNIATNLQHCNNIATTLQLDWRNMS